MMVEGIGRSSRGLLTEPKIGMAVVALEAGSVQDEVFGGNLFHQIDALLAEVALFCYAG